MDDHLDVNQIFTLGGRAELLLSLRKTLLSQTISNPRLVQRYTQELLSIREQLEVLCKGRSA
jgi:hypothetical protein